MYMPSNGVLKYHNGTYWKTTYDASSMTVGDIGTLIFAVTTTGTYNPGTTISGASLNYSNSAGASSGTSPPSGSTWRCLGYATIGNATLWIRIA